MELFIQMGLKIIGCGNIGAKRVHAIKNHPETQIEIILINNQLVVNKDWKYPPPGSIDAGLLRDLCK